MVVAGIRSSRLQLGAGNTETFTPSSTAGINPSCGKELNVAGGPRLLQVGCQWTGVAGFQARSKDQEILEEGGGAGPSLLPRRDHE